MHTLEARLTSPLGFAAVVTASILLWLVALTGATSADGNNGNVKIHSGSEEPTPEVRNEPKVCEDFHMHFFFGDPGQPGLWEVRSWPDGAVVAEGDYTADQDGEAEAAASAAPGHYKLFWQGDSEKHSKHKVFKVEDCEPDTGVGEG